MKLPSLHPIKRLGKVEGMTSLNNPKFNLLKRYRLLYGYSQRDIARKLGIQSTTIVGRWELGQTYPDLKNLIKLSIIYKTLVDQLYPGLRSEIVKDYEEREKKGLKESKPP